MIRKSFFFLSLILINLSIEAQDNSRTDKINLLLPNENHRLFYSLQGTWKQTIERYAGDDEVLFESSILKSNVILQGRVLQMASYPSSGDTSAALEIQQLGYDNNKKKFYIFIITSLSTEPYFSYGDYFPEVQKFIFEDTIESPDKKQSITYSFIIKIERENKFTEEFIRCDGKIKSTTVKIMNIRQ